MNPDHLVTAAGPGDGLGKLAVNLFIGTVIFQDKLALAEQIVKKWPERFVGKACVVPLHLLFGQRDRFNPVAVVL